MSIDITPASRQRRRGVRSFASGPEGAAPRRADSWAKCALRDHWPTLTTIFSAPGRAIHWIRAQPCGPDRAGVRPTAPRLVAAGARRFHIQPDGLWFSLGIPRGEGARGPLYADCVVIEVCGSQQNLNDKRSRYGARTAATMLSVGGDWLGEVVPVAGNGRRSRARLLGDHLPGQALDQLPVRHLRVLYALPDDLYEAVATDMVLEAHEFICRQAHLSQYTSPRMQAFLQGMSPHRHIL